MATIFDVAKEADVSPATVSRVINNSVFVSEDKHERVVEAMKKLGYVPQPRTSKNIKNKTIVVISTFIQNEICMAFKSTATELGYSTQFLFTGEVIGDIRDTLETLKQLADEGKLAGVALINFMDRSATQLLNFVKKYPVVQIGEPYDFDNNYYLSPDEFQAAYDITHRLIDSYGCSNPYALVMEVKGKRLYLEQQRINGFRSALMDRGIEGLNSLIYSNGYSVEAAIHSTRRAIKSEITLDSILCMNTRMAYGCLLALTEMGLEDKIKIASLGEIEPSNQYNPYFISTLQDFSLLGKEAMVVLDLIISGEYTGGRKVFLPYKEFDIDDRLKGNN